MVLILYSRRLWNKNGLIELSEVIEYQVINRFSRAQGQPANCESCPLPELSVTLASNVPGSLWNQLLVCCNMWAINSSLVYIRCRLIEVTAGSVDGVFIMYNHNVYTGCSYTSQWSNTFNSSRSHVIQFNSIKSKYSFTRRVGARDCLFTNLLSLRWGSMFVYAVPYTNGLQISLA